LLSEGHLLVLQVFRISGFCPGRHLIEGRPNNRHLTILIWYPPPQVTEHCCQLPVIQLASVRLVCRADPLTLTSTLFNLSLVIKTVVVVVGVGVVVMTTVVGQLRTKQADVLSAFHSSGFLIRLHRFERTL